MLTVADLMTTDVYTLEEGDSVLTARSIMALAKIRHIPIVDKKSRFLGLVTHRDILGVAISRMADINEDERDAIDSGIPIHEVMRTGVTTIAPGVSLRRAAEILLHNKYGCLPVVQDEELVGILTEADFLSLTISLMDSLSDQEEQS